MRDLGIRQILFFLIAIGLVIFVAILVIRSIGGGSEEDVDAPEPLVSFAQTSTVMRTTIQGPIVADQDFRQIVIEVGRGQTELTINTGYQGRILNAYSFPNNSESYANFLRAIDIEGYTIGSDDPIYDDYRGQCPAGERYLFEIVSSGDTTQQYWATSCRDAQSFGGRTNQILNLFRAQIPGYEEIVDDNELTFN